MTSLVSISVLAIRLMEQSWAPFNAERIINEGDVA